MSRSLVTCWLVGVTLACGGLQPVTARVVSRYSPDEFVAAADAVCNGVVLGIKPTQETTLLPFDAERPEKGGIRMRYIDARVRVIGRYKGKVPTEIRVRYASADPPAQSGTVVNGPDLIDLKPKARYRFYLKAPSAKTSGCYVGVQNGTPDDGRSVELMLEGEQDDAPPFLQSRAQRIATAYIRKTFPDYVARKTDADFDYLGGSWQLRWWVVVGWNRAAGQHREALATVLIGPTGKALPESWIVLGKPERPGRNLQKFLGKRIQITTNAQPNYVTNRNYRGRVEAVTNEGLIGHFIEDWNEFPKPMGFIRREVKTVQLVAETPR